MNKINRETDYSDKEANKREKIKENKKRREG